VSAGLKGMKSCRAPDVGRGEAPAFCCSATSRGGSPDPPRTCVYAKHVRAVLPPGRRDNGRRATWRCSDAHVGEQAWPRNSAVCVWRCHSERGRRGDRVEESRCGLCLRPVRGNRFLATGFNPWTARPAPLFSLSYEPLQGRLRRGSSAPTGLHRERRMGEDPVVHGLKPVAREQPCLRHFTAGRPRNALQRWQPYNTLNFFRRGSQAPGTAGGMAPPMRW